MRSFSHSGLPDGWASTRKRSLDIVANATVIAIAAVSVAFGIASSTAGNYMALRYSLLFGLIMTLVAALGAAMRMQSGSMSNATHTVELGDGSRGTEVRYSKAQFAILVTLMTCSSALFMLAAVETVIGRQAPGISAIGVLLGAIGMALLSFTVFAALGRIKRGGLLLDGCGVAQRGWSFESRLSWAEVAGIKPAHNGYPVILLVGYSNAAWDHRYTTRLWRIDRLPPVPMIEIDCRKFDVDPVALLAYVTAYIETPANRAELGTTAALTRARMADNTD